MKRMYVGERHHRLEVVKIPKPVAGRYVVNVHCSACGKTKQISQSAWRRYSSCGCLQYQRGGHGRTGTAEYRAWQGMLSRCNNPANIAYSDYGARGIKVCKRWRRFENFLADVGEKPERTYRLDRNKVNGNYTPSNCSWVSVQESNLNKRNAVKLLWKGEMHYLRDVAALYGLHYTTARYRLVHGKSAEQLTGDFT